MRLRREEAAAQLKKIRDQLAGTGKVAQKTRSKTLEDQVVRAEALLKSREGLIVRLQGGEIGNRDGYSKFLLALARQRLEGVWLTSIEIAGARDDFAIQGRALRAELLTDYIKVLSKEQAFRGKPIGTLSLRERELEPAVEKAPAAAAPQPAAAGAPAAPGPQGARPAVRVVEFAIGTSLPTGAEAAGK